MRYKLTWIMLFAFFSSLSYSQKIVEKSNTYGRLPWVNGELPSNKSSVNYKVVFAKGQSLAESRNVALYTLVSDLGKDKGVTVSDKVVQNIQEEINSENPGFFKQTFSNDLEITFFDYKLSFAKVDEYYEVVKTATGITYNVWQLFAIDGYPKFNKLEYTTSYGMSTTLKSALVPGWGQFEKKKSTKGILFLVAEGAAIGTFLSANNSYNYNINRSQETQSLELKKEFRSLADKDLALKNASLGLAIGVWLWNVIDASSPNGAPRYASNNVKLNVTSTPYEQLAFNMKIKL